MIASLLLILMTVGCEPPTDSGGSSPPPATRASVESGPVRGADPADSPRSAAGLTKVSEPDDALAGSGGRESEQAALVAEGGVPDTPSPGAFGDQREIDDPFTVIGPAFSGLGLQPYSSDCDPFEEKYGTCL